MLLGPSGRGGVGFQVCGRAGNRAVNKLEGIVSEKNRIGLFGFAAGCRQRHFGP